MKEIVTIDGKQFELMTDYPLTEQQRQQTISDIRKHVECSSCNKTQSLGGSIQTLVATCVNVMVDAPATITITGVKVGTDVCTIGGGCPSHITCPDVSCSDITTSVTVTFSNSGDIIGDITPTLTVGGFPATGTSPALISVPASGTADAEFTGVTLARGPNTVCADFTQV